MLFQFKHNIYKTITIDSSKIIPVSETWNGQENDNRGFFAYSNSERLVENWVRRFVNTLSV